MMKFLGIILRRLKDGNSSNYKRTNCTIKTWLHTQIVVGLTMLLPLQCCEFIFLSELIS